MQVFSVGTVNLDVNTLLDSASDTRQAPRIVSFAEEQRKDPRLVELVQFLEHGKLPEQETRARKISLQSLLFTLVDRVLFFIDPKSGGRRRVVVPEHLRDKIMEENHRGPMGAHFSGNRLFNTLARQ